MPAYTPGRRGDLLGGHSFYQTSHLVHPLVLRTLAQSIAYTTARGSPRLHCPVGQGTETKVSSQTAGIRKKETGLEALVQPRLRYHCKTFLLHRFPGNSKALWPPRNGKAAFQSLLIGWGLGHACVWWSTTTGLRLPSATSLPASRASQSQVGLSAQHSPQLRRFCS